MGRKAQGSRVHGSARGARKVGLLVLCSVLAVLRDAGIATSFDESTIYDDVECENFRQWAEGVEVACGDDGLGVVAVDGELDGIDGFRFHGWFPFEEWNGPLGGIITRHRIFGLQVEEDDVNFGHEAKAQAGAAESGANTMAQLKEFAA